MAEKHTGWLINTTIDNELDKWFTVLLPSFMNESQVVEMFQKQSPTIFGYEADSKVAIYAIKYKSKKLELIRFDNNA